MDIKTSSDLINLLYLFVYYQCREYGGLTQKDLDIKSITIYNSDYEVVDQTLSYNYNDILLQDFILFISPYTLSLLTYKQLESIIIKYFEQLDFVKFVDEEIADEDNLPYAKNLYEIPLAPIDKKYMIKYSYNRKKKYILLNRSDDKLFNKILGDINNDISADEFEFKAFISKYDNILLFQNLLYYFSLVLVLFICGVIIFKFGFNL